MRDKVSVGHFSPEYSSKGLSGKHGLDPGSNRTHTGSVRSVSGSGISSYGIFPHPYQLSPLSCV